MDYYGYSGTVLHVNLTTGEVRREPLDLEQGQAFIGGFGINNRLAYDHIKPGTDPLSPENPLIFGAGPLIGTMAPSASRVMATTKFPLTGAVASASGSMSFASNMKWAGYDHIVVSGRAKAPVYLEIQNDRVEIRDARDLWGRDTNQTTDALWNRHGKAGVICIGPAGENLARFSLALVDKASTLGRGGLGAVMGSKNLKAILAQGTKGVKVCQPGRFMKAVDGLHERVRRYPLHQTILELGIMSNWDNFVQQHISRKNMTEVYPQDKATELYGPHLYRKMNKRGLACPSCFICDKETLELKEGEYAGLVFHTHSFLSIGMLGSPLGIEDYGKAMKLADLLNRYGLCLMTFTSLTDFVIDLYERGVITDRDTQELELERDFDSVLALLEKIVHREGIGDILAEGWTETLRKLGRGSEKEAVLVKGQDCMWDPRLSGLGTMEFEQIVSPRGPTAAMGGSPSYILGTPLERFRRQTERMVPSEQARERIFDSPLGFNPGRLTRYGEDWYSLFSSLGLCVRAHVNRFYHIELCAELYSAATGIELSPAEIMKCAERNWNLFKTLNVREGFTRKNDVIPEKWFRPMKTAEGKEAPLTDYYKSKTLSREEVAQLVDDYYDERGWDVGKGIPTREKLLELNLDKVAEDLADWQ